MKKLALTLAASTIGILASGCASGPPTQYEMAFRSNCQPYSSVTLKPFSTEWTRCKDNFPGLAKVYRQAEDEFIKKGAR